jgi:hypothetical protein
MTWLPGGLLFSIIWAYQFLSNHYPPVNAVVEVPTYRRDGSLIVEAGYDRASGYYYYPSPDMESIVIPEKPTKDDVIAARNVLWGVFGEFPYTSDSDRANNFAFGLTPFIRAFIDGLAPMCYTEVSIAGSGKGLNTDAWALIACGQVAAKCSAVDNTEMEKRIFSLLSAGRTLICIDNVRGKLDSKALENALTAEIYEGRTLGKSEARQMPNLATWCCNGNNATLGGDLPRRCYRVRFTPDNAHPWLKQYRIKDLRTHIRQNRAVLAQACLTMISGWLVAGRPVGDKSVVPLGSYETWTSTMNGILTYAEIGDFLGNMQEFYLENNDEAAQMTLFFEICTDEYKGRAVTTQKIVEDILYHSGSGKRSVIFESLPIDMQALANDKDTTPKGIAKALGYKLRAYKDRPFGDRGCRIVRAASGNHANVATWRFVETVARNLAPWDIKSASDVSDASDVFNARTSKTLFSQENTQKNDFLDLNCLTNDSHSTHHSQILEDEIFLRDLLEEVAEVT